MFCVGAGSGSAPKAAAVTSSKKGEVKLTEYAQGLGCACKMPSSMLTQVLSAVQREQGNDPNLIIGNETNDDCSVYKVSDDLAIVNTTDFFPPIVDDPYDFGRIAAANALSDIYAMGAEPMTALSICTFCPDKLDISILTKILQGANDTATEAGITIGGGHTLRDVEPKFGLAVTGRVHPDLIIRNVGAEPGDVLVLTKPLGVGMLTRTAKLGIVPDIKDAIAQMTTLNAAASRAAVKVHTDTKAVHAMTDVTGFGLAGHLTEMLGSARDATVTHLPTLPAAVQALADHGKRVLSGGAYTNSGSVGDRLLAPKAGPFDLAHFCLDPQTSGGLLMSVAPDQKDALLAALEDEGVSGVVIGAVSAGTGVIRLPGADLAPYRLTRPYTAPPTQEIVKGRAIFVKSDLTGHVKDPKDQGLGYKLMVGALMNLSKKPKLPEKIMLVGSAALMACEGHEGYEVALDALKTMDAAGVDVMVCVTCTDWFKAENAVGRIVTAVDVTDVLSTHDVVTLA
ncbi:Selenide water dikinase [Carpediemonas membranifera]|uniref:Selenide water dikinase n=1 Tax=Carpediemonas membranifera TaxID=201153 RepID=A0A8J6B766_9EUKA|nr:Selenide water dikinase [Carpediemonas membranifera]|eukprot:KAG9395689.1 Selenide water dikinase [Carpediemonas membranifera]